MAQPITIPSPTAMADAAMVGNPGMFQTPFSYDELERRYPVSTPPARYTVPIDEAIAVDALLGQRKARDISMQGQLLSQQIAQKKLDYDNSVQEQTRAALEGNVIGTLVPGSPNYEAQKAEIVRQYPLAAQNPDFMNLLNPLDSSNRIQQQSTEVLKNQAADDARRDAAYKESMGMQLRSEAAKFGADTLNEFDRIAGETQDPIRAFSQVSSAIRQQQAQQIEEKPLTPQQQQAYKLDLIRERGKIQERKAKSASEDGDDAALNYLNSELKSLGVSIPEAAKPAAQSVQEGRIANNPQTGERIIFRNGKWEPYK